MYAVCVNSFLRSLGLVAMGGFIGSAFRVAVDNTVTHSAGALPACAPGRFANPHGLLAPVNDGFAWGFVTGATANPWYLLFVNVVGALILGAITGGLGRLTVSDRLMFGTGACGSFTTYGTLMMLPAGLRVYSAEAVLAALAWCVIILAAGFAATLGGYTFARRVTPTPAVDSPAVDAGLPEDAEITIPETRANSATSKTQNARNDVGTDLGEFTDRGTRGNLGGDGIAD